MKSQRVLQQHICGLRRGTRSYRVAVLGAAGGIGQPLSLLLKQNPLVSELSLYDIVNTPGVAIDLSHICSPARVTGYIGGDLEEAVKGSDVVVIPAGVQRQPGMTRDDLFKTNAGIVKALAEACAKQCPKALVVVVSTPVNSAAPVCAQVFRKAGLYSPDRLFGLTTLDVVRTHTFVAEALSVPPDSVSLKVIGGQGGHAVVPLLSQILVRGAPASLTEEQIESITRRVQKAGDEVVKAKAGAGNSTLGLASAGAHFVDNLLRALSGETVVVDAFVERPVTGVDTGGLEWFSSTVEVGKEGVKRRVPVGGLSAYEEGLLAEATKVLKVQVERGLKFAGS